MVSAAVFTAIIDLSNFITRICLLIVMNALFHPSIQRSYSLTVLTTCTFDLYCSMYIYSVSLFHSKIVNKCVTNICLYTAYEQKTVLFH